MQFKDESRSPAATQLFEALADQHTADVQAFRRRSPDLAAVAEVNALRAASGGEARLELQRLGQEELAPATVVLITEGAAALKDGMAVVPAWDAEGNWSVGLTVRETGRLVLLDRQRR